MKYVYKKIIVKEGAITVEKQIKAKVIDEIPHGVIQVSYSFQGRPVIQVLDKTQYSETQYSLPII